MLPSSRPSYCLRLLPDRITLSQPRRAWRLAGWKRKWTDATPPFTDTNVLVGTHAVQETAMADEPGPHLAQHSTHQPWQRALQACSPLLAELAAGSQLTVVVSNQWLRYKLLPAMPPMQSHAASLAVARALFMDTYGEAAATWHIALEPLPQGGYQFACALDQSLLEAITAMAAQAGCQLVSVQPAMMHFYNRLCRHLSRDLCGLVQVEAGRIHLALMRDGGWLALSACASHVQDWPQQMLALLQREMVLLGDAPLMSGKLYVNVALAAAHSAAWTALQASLAEMGWQAVPVFSHERSMSKLASPATAWVGG
ncbi:hypothetical protein [Methylovorus glucosotrophus]|nr:hypothetical protein [Methylovorus glucosotrophus]